MRHSMSILGVLLGALLMSAVIAPGANAGNLPPLQAPVRASFQGDNPNPEGQDAAHPGQPDETGYIIWQPNYLTSAPAQGTVAGLVNRGLASPLGPTNNGSGAGTLVISNGPRGSFVIPAPPYDHNGPWGSFPSYRAWALAFTAAHGREPTEQDEVDFWASQAYAVQSGIGPVGWRPQPVPPLTQ